MSILMFPVIPILLQLGVICKLTAAYRGTYPANAGQQNWSTIGMWCQGYIFRGPDAIINMYMVDGLGLYVTSPSLNKYRQTIF